MNDPLPDHLREVREILMDSAHGPAEDEPPVPPGDLLDDLEESLGQAPLPSKTKTSPPFFERLRNLFATPAFGLVAALIVVLFIAVPLLNPDHGFRDSGGKTQDAPSVVLLDIDDSTYESLRNNPLFDPEALKRAATAKEASAVSSPKILVDFTGNRIQAIDADGTVIHRQAFTQEDLASAIALALSKIAAPNPDR